MCFVRWIALAAAAPLAVLVGACDAALPRRSVSLADTAVITAAEAMSPAALRAAAAPAGSAVDEAAAFTDIRGWLRRLVVAEETYFAENGTYTATPDTARFLWATRDGWAARARHPRIPGKDCVVYVGASRPAPATAKLRRQAREGVPVCDAPNSPAQLVARRSPPRSPAEHSSAPSAASLPDTGSGLDAVSPIVQMKVDLRNLARSQDAWLGTQGGYSWRTEPFAMQYLWHRGVKLRILSADRESWSARATHDALPGRSCVIWVGPVATAPRTDGQGREAARAAVPVCDDPL